MQKVMLNEEYRSLLPDLDEETYAAFERNLMENGSIQAPILWNDVLIDGYNRYRICLEHNIPVDTVFSKPPREIEPIVVEMEEETYKGIKHATLLPEQDGESAVSLSEKMQRFNTVISNITNDYNSVVQELCVDGGITGLRIALRAYIDTLEDFYETA